jgi:hypothetical protein
MMPVLFSLLLSLRSSFRVRAALQAEILALRHQLLIRCSADAVLSGKHADQSRG